MKQVRLLPSTARLKQVITEHGEIWNQIGDVVPMQCFGNKLGCPIESLDKKHFRNVRLEHIVEN